MMLDKLIKDVAKGVGEAVTSPLTATNAAIKALNREVKELVEPENSEGVHQSPQERRRGPKWGRNLSKMAEGRRKR
jgi:hypothetical protein